MNLLIIDKRHNNQTWQVRTNHGNTIIYGSRDYNEQIRLLTNYSKTEKGERGQIRQEINDRNFLDSALNPIIPQTLLNNLNTSKSINEFAKNLVEIIKVSPDNKLSFYDDICKQTKFKTNLMDINKEKIHKAINNLSINKPGLLEALIKTNLKSFRVRTRIKVINILFISTKFY